MKGHANPKASNQTTSTADKSTESSNAASDVSATARDVDTARLRQENVNDRGFGKKKKKLLLKIHFREIDSNGSLFSRCLWEYHGSRRCRKKIRSSRRRVGKLFRQLFQNIKTIDRWMSFPFKAFAYKYFNSLTANGSRQISEDNGKQRSSDGGRKSQPGLRETSSELSSSALIYHIS